MTLALAAPFAFAGVNRRTTSAVQAIPAASGSPAAGKIAFVSSRDGNPEIYTINTDGTNLTRLTNNPASDEEPGPRMASGSPSSATAAATTGST